MRTIAVCAVRRSRRQLTLPPHDEGGLCNASKQRSRRVLSPPQGNEKTGAASALIQRCAATDPRQRNMRRPRPHGEVRSAAEPRTTRAAPVCAVRRSRQQLTLPPHDEGGLCNVAASKQRETGAAPTLMVRCVAKRSLEPRGWLQFMLCVVRDGSYAASSR
jgi:hypothetical protein